MGTKNQPGKYDCYDKAEDDEPIFTLLARDPLAPSLVRLWAGFRRLTATWTPHEEKADEADALADAMESWAGDHPDLAKNIWPPQDD